MKGSISLIATAHAAVALASFVAVRAVSRAMDGLTRQGGGLGDLSEGITDAARWPMMAAWIAVGASLITLLMLRRTAPRDRPVLTAVLSAIAISASVAAVFVFRATTTFVAYGILPPGVGASAIFGRLTAASAITALCFAGAIAVAVMARRSRVTMSVAVLAVVVSLGVSVTMIVTLRDVSAQFQSIAAGGRLR
jgi:hypothetical protein